MSLQYRPIRQRDGALLEVVVIATDQTEEYAARQIARQQQNFAEMICRIFKERNQFHATLAHLREFLEEANTLPADQSGATSLLRQLHTLKASVKQFCLLELGEVIHKVESEWRDPALADDNEAFHRRFLEGRQQIAAALLKTTDELGSLMGTEHEWRGNIREIEEGDLYAFVYEMEKAQAEPALIRRFLSTIAAVPVHDCFRPFERELKELASMMEKQIKPIRFVGSNPRVLTQPIQEFLFALTHISRNIMDHGIETPVTRMARGKDPAGQVTVDVEIVSDEATGGSWLHLAISDDGNGIDPSRIRAKLASIDPDGNWRFDDDQTVIQQIFTWGVSTNETVTTLSGRGVGLEAVKREVDLLGGRIRVDSELYKGLKFDIRIPYSLDICLVNRPETLKIPLEA
ncbi:MAG: hypothetical protein HGA90_01085 [Alphaproteobacteria bacterium]|nr:hypothetical protein [Alphaproteobacteria bacterium]